MNAFRQQVSLLTSTQERMLVPPGAADGRSVLQVSFEGLELKQADPCSVQMNC